MEKTRKEHVDWCKERAIQELESGDISNALASMASDLGKHAETQNHPAIKLGLMQVMAGLITTRAQMKKFIEGFN